MPCFLEVFQHGNDGNLAQAEECLDSRVSTTMRNREPLQAREHQAKAVQPAVDQEASPMTTCLGRESGHLSNSGSHTVPAELDKSVLCAAPARQSNAKAKLET